jgi:alginate O-acetyltransferase complex protein AlgI
LFINAHYSFKVFNQSKHLKQKRQYAWTGVIINLSLLCFFKYSGLIGNLFDTSDIGNFLISIPLPVGISFYTFQGISLILDLSLAKEHPKVLSYQVETNYYKHLLKTATFISFFPQLVAGPIMRSEEFIPQLGVKYFRDINWEKVIKFLILGYFLKMVVADNLKDVTSYLDAPYYNLFSAYSLVLFMVAYSAQIFGDFAGYSFIAMGLAGMFGYELTLNFNYPYISKSIKDYWRRWHITLYDWFNKYVFNPFVILYREQQMKAIIIGTILVFSLSGIWHGPTLNFLVWGFMHGLVLVVDSILLKSRKKRKKRKKSNLFLELWQMIWVFSYITFSYVIFRNDNFQDIIQVFEVMISTFHFGISKSRLEAYAILYTLPVFIYHLDQWLEDRYQFRSASIRSIGYGLMLYFIFTSSGTIGDFIYFQF